MTTIIDPAGTPEIIFRSNDPVFYTIASAGSNGSDATQIVLYSSRTLVLVTTDDADKGVKLPADGFLGDLLDIVGEPSNPGYKIYKPNGDFFGNNSSGRHLTFTPSGWA